MYQQIDTIIGIIINKSAYLILILYNPAMSGNKSVGTTKDPTIYQISTAYVKYMAKMMDSRAVITRPQRVYRKMSASSCFKFSRVVRSFPIVKAEIKEKLSTVDMTMAKRLTIKSPRAIGDSTN
jgi:hypothetical protein